MAGAKKQARHREYEFEENEAEHFVMLAKALKFVGLGTILVAVLSGLLFAVVNWRTNGGGNTRSFLIAAGAECFLLFVTGALHVRASGPFKRVHTTEGHDVTNMMDGLSRMKTPYGLVAALVVLVTVGAMATTALMVLS